MVHSKILMRFALPILLSAQLLGQSAPSHRILLPREPVPNLGKLKNRLTAYEGCKRADCYGPELDRQNDLGIELLDRRVVRKKPGEKLAVVLDIDETALSNWTEEAQDDYGYIAKDWNAWVDQKQAPAIAGTLRLFSEAEKLGVAVFFISGRSQDQEAVTSINLKTAGYANWAGLALRGPHPASQTTTQFKSGERQKIVAQGYTLILNVGDQMSDLNGSPMAEKSVKLPNPFYYIP